MLGEEYRSWSSSLWSQLCYSHLNRQTGHYDLFHSPTNNQSTDRICCGR
jgi:hypothetical protein